MSRIIPSLDPIGSIAKDARPQYLNSGRFLPLVDPSTGSMTRSHSIHRWLEEASDNRGLQTVIHGFINGTTWQVQRNLVALQRWVMSMRVNEEAYYKVHGVFDLNQRSEQLQCACSGKYGRVLIGNSAKRLLVGFSGYLVGISCR